MAVFGRNSARQRLRRASIQALSVPTFDTPADCTPWVIGGLWPVELQTVTPATRLVAEHLKNDLQRIANSANAKVRALRHAGLPGAARRAEESRVVNEARAYAVARVDSTVRQLHIQALSGPPESDFPTDPGLQQIVVADTSADEVLDVEEFVETTPAPEPEPDEHRLERLLHFAARQEPGLRWAVGERADGTMLLVTDLAHGWIPAGVTLPAEVELLPPARRGGRVRELLGDVSAAAVYQPGDLFDKGAAEDLTPTSSQGRHLDAVDDLGWKLVDATQWRDGLPRLVHTLARAGAARSGVVDSELDVLRVHSDTARYHVLAQYPDVESALLCNCMLLAATEAIAVGDERSANYHFAWFESLSAPAAGQWAGQP